MKTLYIFLLAPFILSSHWISAQQRCHTDQRFSEKGNETHIAAFEKHYAESMQRVSPSRSTGVKFTIPVVFHVIHSPAHGNVGTGSNLSKERLEQQIEILNQDYRKINGSKGFGPGVDTEIEFALAKRDNKGNCTDGIVRMPSALSNGFVDTTDALDVRLKRLSYWNSKDYLNIWVINSLYDGAFGVAHFPWDRDGGIIEDTLDGVIVVASSVGLTGAVTGTDFGRTATHEVAHWLGLYHIFQITNANTCQNDSCLVRGDRVCDTPPQNKSTSLATPCNTNQNTCNTDNINGVILSGFATDQEDMINNYMDYSNDTCMDLFTAGQLSRMQFTLNGFRSAIWQDSNLVQTGIKELPIAHFDSIGTGVNGGVNAFVEWVEKGQLIVAGNFTTAGGTAVNGIAAWNGSVWSTLNNVPAMMVNTIRDMEIYKGDLYVGGSFKDTSFSHLAKYDGTSWKPVTASNISGWGEGPSHSVNAIQVYNGKLYIGGDFGRLEEGVLNINASRVGAWNGATWEQLGSSPYGVSGSSSAVYAMDLYSGQLVIAGRFTLGGNNVPSDKVILWNGSSWTSLSSTTHSNGRVNSLAVFKDHLYAGGDFFGLDTVSSGFMNYFDGATWKPTVGFGLDARDIVVYNNEIYVAGHIWNIEGPQYWNFIRWDIEKKAYENLSAHYNGVNSTVHDLIVFKNELYFGGIFEHVLGIGDTLNFDSPSIGKVTFKCVDAPPPVAVEEVEKGHFGLALYPNPANEQVRLIITGLDEASLLSEPLLYDITGKQLRIPFEKLPKGYNLDISKLANGYYLLGVQLDSGERLIKKLIKQ